MEQKSTEQKLVEQKSVQQKVVGPFKCKCKKAMAEQEYGTKSGRDPQVLVQKDHSRMKMS